MQDAAILVALVSVLFRLPGQPGRRASRRARADDHAKPLKVFILAGQSNMQGHAHVRTFDHIGMDPETAPLLQEMRDADGTPRVCEEVWISSICSRGGEKQAVS